MFTRIKALIVFYRSEIAYLIVGGLTTLVNLAVYFLSRELFQLHYIGANILAWIVAVLFAYIANRIWVFHSKNANILIEFWTFVLSRIFSMLLETGLLFIVVGILNINDYVAKIAIAVLVVVCNYITGKWIVFKRK